VARNDARDAGADRDEARIARRVRDREPAHRGAHLVGDPRGVVAPAVGEDDDELFAAVARD